MIQLSDVWDFHTDLRCWELCNAYQLAYREPQLDRETAKRLGGVFSATGRWSDGTLEEQWAQLRKEVQVIEGLDGLTMVRSKSDLEGTGRQLLHAEGIYLVQERAHLKSLDDFWAMGFRSVAPMYNEDNALGGGAKGDQSRGLTDLGREFMATAWEMGFLVDCAHANHRTQLDCISLAESLARPLNYTHGLTGEPVLEFFGQRGLPEAHLDRLLATGGLVGLAPHPGFYGYFDRFLKDAVRLCELAPTQVALGSDFTGINTPPITFSQFASGAEVPAFAVRLADQVGPEKARQFCGLNIRTMLERCLPD